MRHCVLVLLFSFRVHSNTAERQETPPLPTPTTHIPLHSRLCNYERCRPASPTVLQAFPGINSWCVKDVTHHHYAGRGEDGDGDEDEVVGGGINRRCCWKHSECLTLKVPRSQSWVSDQVERGTPCSCYWDGVIVAHECEPVNGFIKSSLFSPSAYVCCLEGLNCWHRSVLVW